MCCEKKENNALKTILIIIGAIVSVAAVMTALYFLFKKFFKISFECDECDECDCNGCFIDEDDKDFEPICECDDAPAVEPEITDEKED